jgi:hypothetical protein
MEQGEFCPVFCSKTCCGGRLTAMFSLTTKDDKELVQKQERWFALPGECKAQIKSMVAVKQHDVTSYAIASPVAVFGAAPNDATPCSTCFENCSCRTT